MKSRQYALAFIGVIGIGSAAHGADTLTTLFNFGGGDGTSAPTANLAFDHKGNIYGAGGGGALGATVFELSPRADGGWTGATLWSSDKPGQGIDPAGGVIRDPRGDLYGTDTHGGYSGCGSVFALHHAPEGWKFRTLWKFAGGASDGCNASAALNMDATGALYGNSFTGGPRNAGTVFKLTPPAGGAGNWTESVIWSFSGRDGQTPSTQMIFGPDGALYGTSFRGGAGFGNVWRLLPPAAGQTQWHFSVLWTFSGIDGAAPTRGPLALDDTGALYGTCHFGGRYRSGTVFKLAPPATGNSNWAFSTIWSFTRGVDGADPTSGVALTRQGKLIGATHTGAIFQLSPPTSVNAAWTERTLYQFNGVNGSDPEMPPILLNRGVVLGSTLGGGAYGRGAVWELAASH